MTERKEHRSASRRGERLRRKRRAMKNKTTTRKYDGVGRKLPRCKKPTMMKDIKNTEAKFANRTREEGWLTPTATQLVRTILNQVDKVCKLLPVKDWTIELNKFSFMQLEDGSIQGVDYQNGRLKGFKDAYAYVDYQQNGICAFCKKPIAEHHHIIPKCEGGSDGPENLIGLCLKHHEKIQNGEIDSEKLRGKKKKYAGTSVWNQAMPFVYKKLVERFGEKHVFLTTGWEPKKLGTYVISKRLIAMTQFVLLQMGLSGFRIYRKILFRLRLSNSAITIELILIIKSLAYTRKVISTKRAKRSGAQLLLTVRRR